MEFIFILINCDGGHEKQVTAELEKLPVEICSTFGMFDFICKVQVNDRESIEEKIQNIRKIRYITSTNTLHTIPEQE